MDGYSDAIIFFLALQVVATILRCWVRIALVRSFGWDDVALLVTLLLSCGYHSCILAISSLTKNESILDPNFPYNNFYPAISTTLAAEVLYISGSVFLKVALGMLLRRVLIKSWQRKIIYITLAISVIYGTFYFFIALFQCGDPTNFPHKILDNECLSVATVKGTAYAAASINATADWTFGLLPLALLWNTEMNLRTKLSVVLILSLGSIGSICTLIRIAWLYQLTNLSPSFFYDAQGIALMSSMELSVGITCVCAATYKPLFRRFLRNPDSTAYPTDTSLQSTQRRSVQQVRDRANSSLPLQSHTPQQKSEDIGVAETVGESRESLGEEWETEDAGYYQHRNTPGIAV